METVTTDWLQSIGILQDVPANQLQWLIDNSFCKTFQDEEMLFRPGDTITGTHFIYSGKLKIYQTQHNEYREIAIFQSKDISGYLPFSRGKIANLYGQTVGETHLMTFPIEKMPDLIRQHFELTQALVHFMTTRVREYTSLQQQDEKMMALGKLSAGLAHELNNPAAAVVRGAVSLKKHLALMPESFKEIMAIQMKVEEVETVKQKLFSLMNQDSRPVMTMLERNEKEDALLDWLDDHAIENSDEVAENFVEFGFTINDLEEFKANIPEQDLSPVFNWINTNLVTEKIVSDIEEASQRIAHLVGSVKTFTHMDQGHDKQESDIHEGIRNTLVILQHKLKKGNVEVRENYDTKLPAIKILVGEMNQVWINLIDNALDAMENNEEKILEIITEKDGDCLKVSVIDNGPGIPDEIITKIFDPFFTTKEIGKGSGMGLDISNQIIRRHRGHIKADARPGRTCMTVILPFHT